jgi:hypothetical protein
MVCDIGGLNSMRYSSQHFIALAALVLCTADIAQAQTRTAYQVGVSVAQTRGNANTDCYARVFARHAVAVVYPNGSRGWSAASTPTYNNELRQRCGVDRLGDMAAKRQQAPRAARGNTHSGGLRLAGQSGYTGANAACFAKVYSNYASQYPRAGGPNTVAIAGGAPI